MVLDYSILQSQGPAQRGHQLLGMGATRPECAHFLSIMPALYIIIFFRFYHFMPTILHCYF